MKRVIRSSNDMSIEKLSYLIEELSLQVGVADIIFYIARKTSSIDKVVECLMQLAEDNGIEI